MYIVAFWITYLFFTVIAAYAAIGLKAPDWVRVCNVILLPSQGSFNFLIYKFPAWQYRWNIRKSLLKRQKMHQSQITSKLKEKPSHVENRNHSTFGQEQDDFIMKDCSPTMQISELNRISLVEVNNNAKELDLEDIIESL
jgi:hypothetical protein